MSIPLSPISRSAFNAMELMFHSLMSLVACSAWHMYIATGAQCSRDCSTPTCTACTNETSTYTLRIFPTGCTTVLQGNMTVSSRACAGILLHLKRNCITDFALGGITQRLHICQIYLFFRVKTTPLLYKMQCS